MFCRNKYSCTVHPFLYYSTAVYSNQEESCGVGWVGAQTSKLNLGVFQEHIVAGHLVLGLLGTMVILQHNLSGLSLDMADHQVLGSCGGYISHEACRVVLVRLGRRGTGV